MCYNGIRINCLGDNMDNDLIASVWEELSSSFNLPDDVSNEILNSVKLIFQKSYDFQTIYDSIVGDYLEKVSAISMLSPGLATGIKDIENDITINTFDGKICDIDSSSTIDDSTTFDVSSVTKMFTAILLLKMAERKEIDLNKTFADYSPLLSKVDIPIIKALKFGCEIRTEGRLDEENLSEEERLQRLTSAYVYNRDTFAYSDVPYMLVPLLFGDDLTTASDNYINKFYEFYRDELGLEKTGYSPINMTGGIIPKEYLTDGSNYNNDLELFDPKARLLEKSNMVPGHAGVTTNVYDIEKLFGFLRNGLLSQESIINFLTPYRTDTDRIEKNDRQVIINRAMGVYINRGGVRVSDIYEGYSNLTFAAEGSTGAYSVFDLVNGINTSFLPNVKSGSYSKSINTEGYEFGDYGDIMPKNYETTVIHGKQNMEDGRIVRPDGTEMPYARATNNFKVEQLLVLLKLRLAKQALRLISPDKTEEIDAIFKGQTGLQENIGRS